MHDFISNKFPDVYGRFSEKLSLGWAVVAALHLEKEGKGIVLYEFAKAEVLCLVTVTLPGLGVYLAAIPGSWRYLAPLILA